MKTCFVSMPHGRREDRQTGVVVDFDRLYERVLVPAIDEAKLELRSWRSGSSLATQRQALRDVMTCDVLIADVTTSNPNVMYELGVRHASNRGPTVIMFAGRQAPFYVNFLATILYDPLEDLAHPEALRARVTHTLRTASRRSEGSPIYEFFPALRVDLPADLFIGKHPALAYPEDVQRTLTPLRSQAQSRVADVKVAQETLRGTSDVSPAAYLDLLRAYRDAGDWDGLIGAADELPDDVSNDPQAMQLLALALNRRSHEGDQHRAIDLMLRLVVETGGGDAETLAILGRIYKERWKQSEDSDYLEKAANYYRRAFDLQPADFYSGFNAASLLFILHTEHGDAEVAALLPRVKTSLEMLFETTVTDYWVFSAAIEIAVMERDWDAATKFLRSGLALSPPYWTRLASADSIDRLGRRLEGADAESLSEITEALRDDSAGADDDDA